MQSNPEIAYKFSPIPDIHYSSYTHTLSLHHFLFSPDQNKISDTK